MATGPPPFSLGMLSWIPASPVAQQGGMRAQEDAGGTHVRFAPMPRPTIIAHITHHSQSSRYTNHFPVYFTLRLFRDQTKAIRIGSYNLETNAADEADEADAAPVADDGDADIGPGISRYIQGAAIVHAMAFQEIKAQQVLNIEGGLVPPARVGSSIPADQVPFAPVGSSSIRPDELFQKNLYNKLGYVEDVYLEKVDCQSSRYSKTAKATRSDGSAQKKQKTRGSFTKSVIYCMYRVHSQSGNSVLGYVVIGNVHDFSSDPVLSSGELLGDFGSDMQSFCNSLAVTGGYKCDFAATSTDQPIDNTKRIPLVILGDWNNVRLSNALAADRDRKAALLREMAQNMYVPFLHMPETCAERKPTDEP
ncbi:uncharacterized protein EV422DRAFT_160469 [Fimicolochytrium jonesii]|uniref:uncharacterized protein n=1 Tax=Fimicolochytrium jonesii TaxID=1396493 RepID=UPI0022FE58F4|nr:uncharacterized protein EV422DRAFT_160469 [Fimicolochytrium jonesii]KAI8826270.1 hypothetical protein EV422DRAFT_160469 [Fimicolochytrium jonesii]